MASFQELADLKLLLGLSWREILQFCRWKYSYEYEEEEPYSFLYGRLNEEKKKREVLSDYWERKNGIGFQE